MCEQKIGAVPGSPRRRQVDGYVVRLPAHPLWAYLTVVAIPVAAVLVGVVAVFPRAPLMITPMIGPVTGASER